MSEQPARATGRDASMQRRVGDAVLIALIFVVTVYAYLPSLGHLPRGDHRYFLLELAATDGGLDAVYSTISFNRTRRFAPGDVSGFRPLMFAMLAAEQEFFGDAFTRWQAFGIGLHLCLVLFFFRFARIHLDRTFAFLVTLFFAVNAAMLEGVIWHHINAYILSYLFIMRGLELAESSTERGGPGGHDEKTALLAGAYFLLAGMLNEFGVIAGLITSVHLFLIDRNRRVALFVFLPAAFAIALNGVDYAARMNEIVPGYKSAFVGVGSLAEGAVAAGMLANLWMELIFFPSAFSWRMLDRLTMNSLSGAGLFALFILAAYLAKKILLDKMKFSSLFSLHAAVAAGYFVVIFILRVVPRGAEYAMYNLAWTNGFVLFLLMAIIRIAARGGSCVPGASRSPCRVASTLAVIYLAAASLAHAVVVHRSNVGVAEQFRPARVMLAELARFVANHESEPGFSFRMEPSPEEDYYYGPPVAPAAVYLIAGKSPNLNTNSYAEIVFARHISDSPAYLVSWNEGKLCATRK